MLSAVSNDVLALLRLLDKDLFLSHRVFQMTNKKKTITLSVLKTCHCCETCPAISECSKDMIREELSLKNHF